MQTFNLKTTTLLSALLLEISTGAHSATIAVDGVQCNLNDAITAANIDTITGGCDAGSSADILELTDGANIVLTESPTVTSEVTMNGNGSTVSGTASLLINEGDLTINDTNFVGVIDDYAPINVLAGNLDINRSIISGNTGGGVLFRRYSTGSVVDSLIENNVNGPNSFYYGAALSIGGSTVTVSNSTISGNTNNVTNGSGGGIWTNNFLDAVELTIINSTISGNTSNNRGGGISHSDYYNRGIVINLQNVTLVGNTSSANGGGLSSDGADINISQTIISGNVGTGGANIDSSAGTITVDDYNIIGLNNDAGVVGVTLGASDIVPTQTTLTEIVDVNLQDNGGVTPTHALVDNSPAIDAVPAANCVLMADQTGKTRPLDGDGDMVADCDIGAFEYLVIEFDVIFKDGFEE